MTLEELRQEHHLLETDLRTIMHNIPQGPKRGFAMYADDRVATLSAAGCAIGDPMELEKALLREYDALAKQSQVVLLFSKLNKIFLDTLSQKIFF